MSKIPVSSALYINILVSSKAPEHLVFPYQYGCCFLDVSHPYSILLMKTTHNTHNVTVSFIVIVMMTFLFSGSNY